MTPERLDCVTDDPVINVASTDADHSVSTNHRTLVSVTHCDIIIIIIYSIIVWLVRCWTLPFLRAFSRLDDSALDDRRLPDQC